MIAGQSLFFGIDNINKQIDPVGSFLIPQTPSEVIEINRSEAKTPEPVQTTIVGILSAYTSDSDETDDTPNTTASGEKTREGIVANNCLEFGTNVVIYGKKYEVQDRMNQRYGCEYFDIWMEDKEDAIQFGRQERQVRIHGGWIDHRLFSSCVKTARWLGLNLPPGDAEDLVPNSKPVVGGGILLKYKDVHHVAVITGFTKDSYLVSEGNYEYNQFTQRSISFKDKSIVGFVSFP